MGTEVAGEGPAKDLAAGAGDREPGPALRLEGALAQGHVPTDASHGIGAPKLGAAEVAGDRLVRWQSVVAERLTDDRVVQLGRPRARSQPLGRLLRPPCNGSRVHSPSF